MAGLLIACCLLIIYWLWPLATGHWLRNLGSWASYPDPCIATPLHLGACCCLLLVTCYLPQVQLACSWRVSTCPPSCSFRSRCALCVVFVLFGVQLVSCWLLVLLVVVVACGTAYGLRLLVAAASLLVVLRSVRVRVLRSFGFGPSSVVRRPSVHRPPIAPSPIVYSLIRNSVPVVPGWPVVDTAVSWSWCWCWCWRWCCWALGGEQGRGLRVGRWARAGGPALALGGWALVGVGCVSVCMGGT
jgi:hypothetical protein